MRGRGRLILPAREGEVVSGVDEKETGGKLMIINLRRYTYIISAVIILAGIVHIGLNRGLKMGIDFAGGNVIQVRVLDESVDIGEMRDVLVGTGHGNNVQKINEPGKNIYILRTLAQEKNNERVINDITGALRDRFGADGIVIEKVDSVGPRISALLLRSSYIIGAVALVLILLYITFRFRFRFGVAAIIALIHDVLIVLSFISFSGKEMSTFILAALLTIIGYSLNDTIVVFDRARENLKSSKSYQEYPVTINRSIRQSLSRTLITSVTTLIAVLSLFIFGGDTLRDFAFALIVGIIAGTYSSMFIASALIVDWHLWHPEKVKKA
jgi:preprotein translocase subunit SecF